MASRRPQRRNRIMGQFAPRLIEMLNSPPYRVLSLSARRVLDRLEVELGAHGGKDNGELPCRYDDFEEYGIHRHAIAPAIREAVALGFVEITVAGRAGNAEYRAPNQFRLTYRPTDKHDASDEWRRVQSAEDAEARARLARTPRHKTKLQWRKKPRSVAETITENPKSPVPETTTTPVAETATTLDISGRERRSPSLRPWVRPTWEWIELEAVA